MILVSTSANSSQTLIAFTTLTSISVYLPMGDPNANYAIRLTAQIQDIYGAVTSFNLSTITVYLWLIYSVSLKRNSLLGYPRQYFTSKFHSISTIGINTKSWKWSTRKASLCWWSKSSLSIDDIDLTNAQFNGFIDWTNRRIR